MSEMSVPTCLYCTLISTSSRLQMFHSLLVFTSSPVCSKHKKLKNDNAVAWLSPKKTDIRALQVADSSLMISFGFPILRRLLASNYSPTQHGSVLHWEQKLLFVCVTVVKITLQINLSSLYACTFNGKLDRDENRRQIGENTERQQERGCH